MATQRKDITTLDPTQPEHLEILGQFQSQFVSLEVKIEEQKQLLELYQQRKDITQMLTNVGQHMSN